MADELVDALVGLGSNLEPDRYLPRAVAELAGLETVVAVSSAWATEPVGPPGQLPFVNAAVRVRTRLPAVELKSQVLREVERRLGRHRTSDRYAPRPIDLDLVAFGGLQLRIGGREVPDPELLRYAHIAVPASEVAADWTHPRTGETLQAIAERLVAALPPEARPRRLALALR
jgi:2-amino-4-hydroxy-6-hydroxymethyldihydropteridine diphosphokinase